MAGGCLTVADDRAHEVAVSAFSEEVDLRRRTVRAPKDVADVDRAAKMAAVGADHDHPVAIRGGADASHLLPVAQKTDAGNRRRRKDRDAVGLVVERDVAG